MLAANTVNVEFIKKLPSLINKARTDSLTGSDYQVLTQHLTQKIGTAEKTIVHYLAEHDCVRALQYLFLNIEAVDGFSTQDAAGCMPLHLACKNEHVETICYLAEVTPSVVEYDKQGLQPLMHIDQAITKIFNDLGINDKLVTQVNDDIQLLANQGKINTLNNAARAQLAIYGAKLSQDQQLSTRLAKLSKIEEVLTKAINRQAHREGQYICMENNQEAILKSEWSNLSLTTAEYDIHVMDQYSGISVPFIGAEMTASLLKYKCFVAEFENFIPTYAKRAAEYAVLRQLQTVPLAAWATTAKKILVDNLRADENRQAKKKFCQDFKLLAEKLLRSLTAAEESPTQLVEADQQQRFCKH